MRASSLALALALSLGTGSAWADLDWALISTTGDPDPVTAFDLADPAGSLTEIGTVQGNFNRGMDFDTPNSFYYYVSTDSLNDPGDRGLWYWDNNVNTQLATTSFDDSTDGDATLSNDGTRFFVTTSDGDATSGDSLYVFDNLGGAVTFTEIGETGLTDLIGIAMDPVSGLLYGYDGGNEALYTISTVDATPTLVGFSGQSVGSIGAMDFSGDGSVLLLADGSDVLFQINKLDGSAVSVGDTNLNASALSFRVPEPATLMLLGAAGLLAVRRR